MLKKTFVSISFSSPYRVQVLQLNASRKSIKKLAAIDLPEGLIKNFRVTDEGALAQLLVQIWKKGGFKEKSVGLVVPESSTLTKILKLPRLGASELDEAVRWQAAEYLPHKKEDVVLDWKIIKEDEDGLQVLVVAILKEILSGYVNSAHQAGLFPLVVETPSISLVRISDSNSSGSLILYENFGQVILLISQGQRIIAGSVVGITEKEEAVNITSKMLKHYKDINVEKILVGGLKLDQALAKSLQTTLKIPVEWIKPLISGVEAKTLQEYLIPISLQLKDPAEPADESTVNLLPPQLVKKYQGEKLKHQIWSLSLVVTLVIWIAFFSTVGVTLFLGQQVAFYKQEDSSSLIPPEKAEYIGKVKDINTTAAKVLVITEVTTPPQLIFNAISKAKPQGVSILRYRVDLETGGIDLIGVSQDRQSLIDFKDELEKDINFSLVNIPISSYEEELNLEYVMKFSYLPISSIKPQIPARR